MTESARSQSRFLIREGCQGWMVYDRERKGPALVGTDWAVNLTREHAERLKSKLTAKALGHSHLPFVNQ
ncbi:hypothetical protein C7G41_21235 [Bradyrhizobium sp. MOS002]|nr:hypothetical protein C7G41_21235 [Bradyrhizobium sp. MOS002]